MKKERATLDRRVFSCLQVVESPKNGRIRSVSSEKRKPGIDALALVQELQARQIELEIQNEQLELAKQKMEETLERYSDIYNFAPTGLFILDEKGYILEVNDAGAKLLGVGKNNLLNEPFELFIPVENRQSFSDFFNKAFETSTRQICELSLLNGVVPTIYAHIEGMATCRSVLNERQLRIAVIDIPEHKKVENALSKSELEKALEEEETRYKELFNNISSGVAIYEAIDNGNDFVFMDFNKTGERLDGDRKEDLIGKRICEVRPGVLEFGLFEVLKRVWKTGIPEHLPSTFYKDNKLSGWYENYVYKLPSGDIVAVFDNVTERKKTEKSLQESERMYRTIFENTGTATIIIEDNTIISLVNSQFERLIGYSKEEIEGKISWTEFVVKEDIERAMQQHKLRRMDPDAALRNYEFRARDKEGHIKDILLQVDIIPGTKRSVASWMDITERKQTEKMLKASLAEKEVLLKEVHHRVKNNLQVVSTLLYLHSLNFTDGNVLKVFKDCQGRIKSMALIHESIYKSKSLNKVDFNEYLKQLISHISRSYSDFLGKISFKISSDNVSLNINTAISCGMIICELVTNSIKYAFPDSRRGEICIDFSSTDDGFKMVVRDNGIGFMRDSNIEDSKTLGLQLVDILVRQINGKMTYDVTHGTRCEICFKEKKRDGMK